MGRIRPLLSLPTGKAEEIAKAIRNLPAPASAPPVPTPRRVKHAGVTVPQMIGLLAIVLAAVIVWLIFR